MTRVKVTEGEVVVRQGVLATAFYVIESGRFDIYIHDDISDDNHGDEFGNLVDHVDDDGYFNEYELIATKVQMETVVARTSGLLWRMDGVTFRYVVASKRNMFDGVMRVCPLLNALDEMEKQLICTALIPRSFDADECIIRQGDVPGPMDGMYFIESGETRVTIFIDSIMAEKEVAQLPAGKYFGEMALLIDKPRTANVYAVGPVKTAFLERCAFQGHLSPWMDILSHNTKLYKYSPHIPRVLN